MNARPVPILLGVLVLLIGVAWLTGTFDRTPSTLDVPELSFDPEDVNRIDLTASGFALTLVREGGRWRLHDPDAPADSAAVKTLLDDLSGARLQSVVSRSPDRYAEFGVDSTASRVHLSGEDVDRTWMIASSGPGMTSGYVRLDGDARVFSMEPRVRVPATMDRWRDRRVLSVSPISIAQLDIRRPDGGAVLERGDSGWSVGDDGSMAPADSAAVVRYLRNLDPLRVDGFLPAADEDAAAASTHELRITRTDGSVIVVSSRDADGEQVLLVSDDPFRYRINASRLGVLFPGPDTFQ